MDEKPFTCNKCEKNSVAKVAWSAIWKHKWGNCVRQIILTRTWRPLCMVEIAGVKNYALGLVVSFIYHHISPPLEFGSKITITFILWAGIEFCFPLISFLPCTSSTMSYLDHRFRAAKASLSSSDRSQCVLSLVSLQGPASSAIQLPPEGPGGCFSDLPGYSYL